MGVELYINCWFCFNELAPPKAVEVRDNEFMLDSPLVAVWLMKVHIP